MKVFSNISMKNKVTLGGGFFNKIVESRKIDPAIYKKKQIEFLDYQYFGPHDDEEMMDEEIEILDYFVEEGNGMGFCQGTIGEGYIQSAFETSGIIGKIMTIGKDGLYVGFILFEEKSKFSLRKGPTTSLYLNLLCAVSTKDFPVKKGIPVGALLIKEMEKYAKENGIKEIYANAVPNALSFYQKNGYKTVSSKFVRKFKKFFKREDDEIPIVKKIKIKKQIKGGKKKIRKHSGINQLTGRLKKGYKYSEKLKSGLSRIIKVKKGGGKKFKQKHQIENTYIDCNIVGCKTPQMKYCCPHGTPAQGYCRVDKDQCSKIGMNISQRKGNVSKEQLAKLRKNMKKKTKKIGRFTVVKIS